MDDPLHLSVPLAGVETDLPLLPEADYQFQVKESTVDANKAETGRNWNLKLGLATKATATDGREVNPDFPVFMTLALQAKEGSTDPTAFKRSLAETVDAIFGTTKENRPDMSMEVINSAIGKVVTAHVYVDDYQGRKSNKVKRLKKPVA